MDEVKNKPGPKNEDVIKEVEETKVKCELPYDDDGDFEGFSENVGLKCFSTLQANIKSSKSPTKGKFKILSNEVTLESKTKIKERAKLKTENEEIAKSKNKSKETVKSMAGIEETAESKSKSRETGNFKVGIEEATELKETSNETKLKAEIEETAESKNKSKNTVNVTARLKEIAEPKVITKTSSKFKTGNEVTADWETKMNIAKSNSDTSTFTLGKEANQHSHSTSDDVKDRSADVGCSMEVELMENKCIKENQDIRHKISKSPGDASCQPCFVHLLDVARSKKYEKFIQNQTEIIRKNLGHSHENNGTFNPVEGCAEINLGKNLVPPKGNTNLINVENFEIDVKKAVTEAAQENLTGRENEGRPNFKRDIETSLKDVIQRKGRKHDETVGDKELVRISEDNPSSNKGKEKNSTCVAGEEMAIISKREKNNQEASDLVDQKGRKDLILDKTLVDKEHTRMLEETNTNTVNKKLTTHIIEEKMLSRDIDIKRKRDQEAYDSDLKQEKKRKEDKTMDDREHTKISEEKNSTSNKGKEKHTKEKSKINKKEETLGKESISVDRGKDDMSGRNRDSKVKRDKIEADLDLKQKKDKLEKTSGGKESITVSEGKKEDSNRDRKYNKTEHEKKKEMGKKLHELDMKRKKHKEDSEGNADIIDSTPLHPPTFATFKIPKKKVSKQKVPEVKEPKSVLFRKEQKLPGYKPGSNLNRKNRESKLKNKLKENTYDRSDSKINKGNRSEYGDQNWQKRNNPRHYGEMGVPSPEPVTYSAVDDDNDYYMEQENFQHPVNLPPPPPVVDNWNMSVIINHLISEMRKTPVPHPITPVVDQYIPDSESLDSVLNKKVSSVIDEFGKSPSVFGHSPAPSVGAPAPLVGATNQQSIADANLTKIYGEAVNIANEAKHSPVGNTEENSSIQEPVLEAPINKDQEIALQEQKKIITISEERGECYYKILSKTERISLYKKRRLLYNEAKTKYEEECDKEQKKHRYIQYDKRKKEYRHLKFYLWKEECKEKKEKEASNKLDGKVNFSDDDGTSTAQTNVAGNKDTVSGYGGSDKDPVSTPTKTVLLGKSNLDVIVGETFVGNFCSKMTASCDNQIENMPKIPADNFVEATIGGKEDAHYCKKITERPLEMYSDDEASNDDDFLASFGISSKDKLSEKIVAHSAENESTGEKTNLKSLISKLMGSSENPKPCPDIHVKPDVPSSIGPQNIAEAQICTPGAQMIPIMTEHKRMIESKEHPSGAVDQSSGWEGVQAYEKDSPKAGEVPNYYQKTPLAQSLIDKCKDQPLLGLEYMVEVRQATDVNLDACNYLCVICSLKTTHSTLVSHVKSIQHKLKFTEIHCSDLYKEYGSYSPKEWTSTLIRSFTEGLAQD